VSGCMMFQNLAYSGRIASNNGYRILQHGPILFNREFPIYPKPALSAAEVLPQKKTKLRRLGTEEATVMPARALSV